VAVGPGVGPGPEAPVEEAPTEFDVILTGFGAKKIQVIKALRELTSLGLKEAKEVVESAPKPIKEAIPKEEAEEVKKKIEDAGGTADIKPTAG
jgi:large subunit ribosomal protein L7/L12